MTKKEVCVINTDDAKNRVLINSDTKTNFFVEAGAGSGKTTELVNRMLAMVESGIDVSEICAITFTKAAANEFYDRFQKRLKDVGTPKALEALKNIDLCFMGTIDSFTNMIISEHPSDALVPADVCVVNNFQMHELWKSQLANIADGKYGTDLKEKYRLFAKYCKNTEEYFIAGLDFLLSTKNVKFEYVKPPKGDFNDVFKDEINDVTEALKFLVGDDIKVLNDGKGDRKAVYFAKLALGLCANFEKNFDSIMQILPKLSGEHGLRFDKSVDLDNYPGATDYVKKLFYQSETKKGAPSFWLIKKISDQDNPFHKKEFDNYVYSVTADFIYSCCNIISEELRKQGKLSYSDYLFYLKEMLKRDSENGCKLINHINKRHKYYLIDEFQDTDPVQAEVFFYLTAKNINEIKSWKDCIPRPGSLFIVGDPKQSIYRFRNADVASYLNVKKLFENDEVGQVLYLTNNFRSHEPMCSWFNDSFKVMLKEKAGIQSAYIEIPTKNKKPYKASFGGAQKQEYIGGSLKNSAATGNLVTIINEIVDNEKYTIEEPPRKINFKDIMVITYKKAHLKFYMDALRKNNIPYYVEGNVLFDDCPALTALSAILNLIVAPKSKKAKVGVDLLTVDGMDPETVNEYKIRSANLTPVSLASVLIDEQRILAQFGTKNIEYLYYAIELLRSKEVSGEICTIYEAAQFLSDLACGNSDEERCLQFAIDDNRVHLANLHKVKGLQAPVVIMTEAKMGNHDPQKHVDFISDNPHSCMFEISGEGFGSKISNWNNEEEKQLEAEILEAEKDRLLYVAATRAKSAFIASDFRLKNGSKASNNQAENLIEHIDNKISIGEGVDEAGGIIVHEPRAHNVKTKIINRDEVGKLYTQAKNHCVINKEKEKETYQVKRPSKLETIVLPKSDTNSRRKKENAALIGTIVHRLMELIVNSKSFEGDYEKIIRQVIDEFNIKDASCVNALHTACLSAKDLLFNVKDASEVYCEIPFCYKKDKTTLCDGVIDLVYCKDGIWNIVDYKTNSDERFLEKKYEKQLSEYKLALKEILGVEANARIEHLKV